jgi:NADPH:quinone reductase-like Zn-dependent oxidoreductase
MRAVVQKRYGGPEQLELVEVPTPTISDRDILVKIHATNIASGDMRVNTLDVPIFLKPIMRLVFGWNGPRHSIRGISAAGEVVQVGSKITSYKTGDQVYFINSMKAGCLAEYIALSEKSIMAKMPTNRSYVEAAPIAFGALTAIHFMNPNNIKKDDKVLIYGASGAVGSYAVQLAKHYGGEVTAVSSKKNHQLLLDLGASHVIDYQTTDFRDAKKQYNVIFDAVGKLTKKSCASVLKKNGTYLTVKMPTKESITRLERLNAIIEKGELKTVLDKVYSFEQFKEAHIHTYGGHKVGNVVIQITT